jgi:hypothetical protein
MAELQKTGESQYDVLIDGQTIGQVWNRHGSWSAQAGDKTYEGLKSGSGYEGVPEPLRRSMREREKEGQRHQDIDGKLVALGYWEIKSR